MMIDAGIPPFISPNGPAQSMVSSAGSAVVFNNVVDLLGVGAGMAPPGIIGNPASGFWGYDPDAGLWRLELMLAIGTAFATSNSATAEFALQGAPDTGSAGGYQPGVWETFATTGAKAASELLAATVGGKGVFRMNWPPAPPATLTPRFMRMEMIVPSGTNFTAGTISYAIMVQGRDNYFAAQQAAANYTVA